MSDSESVKSVDSSRSYEDSATSYHSSDDGNYISASLETAHFRSILQCFSEKAKYTFILFDPEGITMFPNDMIEETTKTKKKKDSDEKNFSEPRIIFSFDSSSIQYTYRSLKDRVFLSFVTKEIIQDIKHYGKKESLILRIDEREPTVISFTSSQMSAAVSSITAISGRSIVEGIYEPLDPKDLADPVKTHICKAADYKGIFSGICSGTARTQIECAVKVKKSGIIIISKRGGHSQTFSVNHADMREETVVEYNWGRSTVSALKKLSTCDGDCSFILRDDDTLSIERKIGGSGFITFSF